MEPLKLLNMPMLSENVLKSLTQNRIITILDFLDEDVTKLCVITKLDLSQILALRNDIFSKFSAPLVNGTILLIKKVIRKSKLITGIESLDAVLEGGIPIGFITELCGLADSGKTQLCFQIAINCVKQLDWNVLYVDTKGDFSAIRIQNILDAYGCSPKEMGQIMFKIRVVHIWNMEDLIDLFKSLKNETIIIENLALIIVDSLPSLMFQHLGEVTKIGLSYLNTFVNYARYLCKQLDIGVLCVNIQTRWVDQEVADLDDEVDVTDKDPLYIEKRNRCLGKYWQHIPALVIQLEKIQDMNSETHYSKIDVTVMKSNSITNFSHRCNLYINNLGVT